MTVIDDKICAMTIMKNLLIRFFKFFNVSLFYQQHENFIREYVMPNLKSIIKFLNHENNYLKHFFKKRVAILTKKVDLFDADIQILKR